VLGVGGRRLRCPDATILDCTLAIAGGLGLLVAVLLGDEALPGKYIGLHLPVTVVV